MALESEFTYKKGERLWIDHHPMVEKRADDYLRTQEHKTCKELKPAQWGGDGESA